MNIDAFSLEQFSQFLDLFLELPDKFSVGVLVDDSLADNLFGPISVSVDEMIVIAGINDVIFYHLRVDNVSS